MNKFIMKSLINSVLPQLPGTLKGINDMILEEKSKYDTDFVLMLSSVNNELCVIPGTIDDNNNFCQKKVSINGKDTDFIKVENFVRELINKRFNED